jgi:hypothetical protein
MQNRAIVAELPPQQPIRNMVVGTAGAAHRVGSLLCQVADAVMALRETARRMPLMITLLALGLGYVVGKVRHGIRHDDQRSP